jgi:tetratricopeptide (TPR) repeat protein
MATDVQSSTALQHDLSFLDDVSDADLESIWESIQEGDESLSEYMGFDEGALNGIEQIALGYYRARRYKQAASIYGFILRLDIERASAWRGLGACAHAEKSYLLALCSYEAAVHWQPEDIVSRVYAGECLCMLGDRESGLAKLQEVVDGGSEDNSLLPYVTRARAIIGAEGGVPARIVLMKQGKELLAETEEALRDMGVEFDENAEVGLEDMMRNPQLRQGLKDVKEAMEEGRLTLAEVGGFSDIELDGTYAVASNHVNAGQTVEGIEICGYLMMLDPYNGRYYQLAGIALQRMKLYDFAEHYYRVALTLDKKDPMTMVYRGESKILSGQIDEGIEIIKEGVALAEGNTELLELKERGEVLLRQFGS